MSLFAEYKKEREGKECIEEPWGFITYGINKEDCYIEDLYVVPDYRRNGGASALAKIVEDAVRALGCKKLWGSIAPSTNGSTESMKALLSYGFKLQSCKENFILFVKEIL